MTICECASVPAYLSELARKRCCECCYRFSKVPKAWYVSPDKTPRFILVRYTTGEKEREKWSEIFEIVTQSGTTYLGGRAMSPTMSEADMIRDWKKDMEEQP